MYNSWQYTSQGIGNKAAIVILKIYHQQASEHKVFAELI